MTGETTTPVLDLSHESGLDLADWGAVAVVFAIGLAFLIRTYTRRKSGCSSCGSGGKGGCGTSSSSCCGGGPET